VKLCSQSKLLPTDFPEKYILIRCQAWDNLPCYQSRSVSFSPCLQGLINGASCLLAPLSILASFSHTLDKVQNSLPTDHMSYKMYSIRRSLALRMVHCSGKANTAIFLSLSSMEISYRIVYVFGILATVSTAVKPAAFLLLTFIPVNRFSSHDHGDLQFDSTACEYEELASVCYIVTLRHAILH
jgi:hypothetical protein